MNDKSPPKDGAKYMRGRYDNWVANQAKRLGCQHADILAAVKDFGLVAADIAKLTDKAGLKRYASGGIGLTILGHQPIARRRLAPARREFTTPLNPGDRQAQPKVKTVKRGHPARQRATRRSSHWPGDAGATSMAQALRRVGFKS